MLKRTTVLFFAGLMAWLGSSFALAQDWYIDVRTPQEVAGGMVDGAVNIEYQDIVAGVEKLGVKKDDTIYLYCRSGRRADMARDALHGAGYGIVENLGSYEQARDWVAKHPQPKAAHDHPH